MHRTRIKFCGITSVGDALAAADCGADAIGLVLHAQSRRRVEVHLASEIVRALPPFVTPVGLFVDAPPDLIRRAVADVGLRHVQLHGAETPELAALLPTQAIIKAIRVTRETLAAQLGPWRGVANLAGLLLDTGGTNRAGGSGVENDWDAIAPASDAGVFRDQRLILAGGLRPDNVGEVVRRLRPWAVDVSSGIEQAPGEKSVAKMRAFAQAVREADSL